MPVLEDDNTPKRSREIRAEIRGWERGVSEAAERHDNYDLTQAQNALADAKRRAKFEAETGFASVGKMIAHRFTTGESAQVAKAFGITNDSASTYLGRLVKSGRLTKSGRGRYTPAESGESGETSGGKVISFADFTTFTGFTTPTGED
jgi:hypothetical protein